MRTSLSTLLSSRLDITRFHDAWQSDADFAVCRRFRTPRGQLLVCDHAAHLTGGDR